MFIRRTIFWVLIPLIISLTVGFLFTLFGFSFMLFVIYLATMLLCMIEAKIEKAHQTLGILLWAINLFFGKVLADSMINFVNSEFGLVNVVGLIFLAVFNIVYTWGYLIECAERE